MVRSGLAVAWLAVLLSLVGCVSAPRIADGEWHKTAVGLCEDYPEESRTLAAARADLAATQAAGAQVLRIAFGWDSMEPQRGKYDWSFWDDYVRLATDEYRIRLIPYVCYTPKWAATDQGENSWRSPPRDPADYAQFVGELVHRYRDRIHSWELWNEPDNQAYWLGTTAQFGALVRAGSAAIRAADPQATVVLGGIAGELDYLAKLLRDEQVGRAVDVINVHSYYETWHPSPIEHLPVYLEGAARLIHENGGTQSLWMAETGYSSVGGRSDVSSVYRAHFQDEHTVQAQAAALVRTFATALATNQVAVLAWYRINDLVGGQEVIGDDNNRHLGVRDTQGRPKPALAAFAYLAGLFRQPFQTLAPALRVDSAVNGKPEVRAFRLADGRRVAFAWLATPEEPAGRFPVADERRANVRIQLPGPEPRRVEFREAAGAREANPTWRHGKSGTEIRCTLQRGEVQIAELIP